MKDKKYWTTLDELNQTPEYEKLKNEEFKNKPADDMEEGGGLLNTARRSFIKITGAASVFMAAGCRDAEKKLIPYVEQPEELIPGNPIYYATTDGKGENGIIAKVHEGRPIKVDGNPLHAVNEGKLDATGNASIIDLYDPDRQRFPAKIDEKGNPVKVKWSEAAKETAESLTLEGPKSIFVSRPIHGKANKKLVKEFLASFKGIQHIEIDSSISDSTLQSQAQSYGTATLPVYRYDKARLIVSLGFDFLSEASNPTETAKLFANAKRIKNGTMTRFISFEPYLSMAGGSSDERYRVKPQDIAKIAYALADEVIKQTGNKSYSGLSKTLSTHNNDEALHLPKGTIKSLAEELIKNKGQSLVLSGGSAAASTDGISLLNAVNLINTVLDNDGKTVAYGKAGQLNAEGTPGGLQKLVKLIDSGKAQAILFQDINLVYEAGLSANLAEKLKKVRFKAAIQSHHNETSQVCDYILPTLHYLESWNDGEPRTGLHSLTQPLIKPLWDNQASQQSLIAIAAESKLKALKAGKWSDYIKSVWSKEVYNANIVAGDFTNFWNTVLRRGVYDTGEKTRNQNQAVRVFKATSIKPLTQESIEGDQVVMFRSGSHGDGSSMNNPWLLEAPDPISKISWENHLSVSLKTAKDKGYKEGQIIKVQTQSGVIEAPIHIQPGVADNVYAIALGWSRPDGGKVAKGPDPDNPGNGVDVSILAPSVDGISLHYGVKIKKIKETDKSTRFACMQGHQYLTDPTMRATGEKKRRIVQDTTLDAFNDPNDKSYELETHYHAPVNLSLWRKQYPTAAHKWAMVIDPNTCTGCNACTISCQAENNVPCVGKDEIVINREMHWIRIDRYYSSKDGQSREDTDEVDVINQPMLCQHCDNASCEIVCPALATSHNDEGLNVQTYNRCVGTRYCSNNCPYKVRHYNWYDYTDYRGGVHGSGNPLKRFLRSLNEEIDDKLEYPLMLQFNPDVTVRSRGVMEKCTFCIQKIRRWKTEEQSLGQKLPESKKQAACQQACPSDAITFGDILDPESSVSKKSQLNGAYHVLEELNNRPNVTYLTKIRNRKALEKPKTDEHHDSSHPKKA